MRILSAQEIKEAEKFTMKKQGLGHGELMERAAMELFEWIDFHFRGTDVRIHLFCGIGNNGGDGMALARLLLKGGYEVKVHVVNFSETRSKEFLMNMERLKEHKLWPEILNRDSGPPPIDRQDLVVDAIFGLGLNRPPDPWVGELIEHINAAHAFVLSVDLPSGLPMDRSPWNPDHVIKATVTLCIQWPKLVFFLPDNEIHCPHWELLDIGMEPVSPEDPRPGYELMADTELLPFYIPRGKFSHKGDFGHALIVGGSKGMIGAVQLAASACLSSGSGKVTVHVPECGYHSLQTALPEVMVRTDQNEKIITGLDLSFEPSAIGVGVGMGSDAQTVKAFASLLEGTQNPMVLDADALNILAAHPELLAEVPPRSILTPHPKELERLIGAWKNDFEKLDKAMAFAIEYDFVLVIKGANSMILHDGNGYVNPTGNPGMATAGSGDVLTGMVTGLLAQGYPPPHAAMIGVYLHGLAGDMCAFKHGPEAVRATGIIKHIGKAFKDLCMEDLESRNFGEVEIDDFDDDDFEDDFD